MGSMLKFDSERRELVRERRNARIERKLERRQARERKHSQTADVPSAPSATQVLAERELRSAVDRIVIDALDRHERIAPPATPPAASTRLPEPHAGAGAGTDDHARRRLAAGSGRRAGRAASATSPRSGSVAARRSRRRAARPAGGSRGPGSRRRSPTRSRRSSTRRPRRGARSASSSRRRSRPGGSPRSAPPPDGPVGDQPRRGAHAPRRARRDPDLALAACVAYAILARVPRTALSSAQRARPIAQQRSDRRRAFWR